MIRKMEEKFNHKKMRLSEQLPQHSPNPGAWDRLSSSLDALDAETAYHEKLEGLPVHSPDEGMWEIISRRLARVAYLRTGTRIAISAAAVILLFFTVSRVIDYQGKTTSRNNIAQQGIIKPIKPTIGKSNTQLPAGKASSRISKNSGLEKSNAVFLTSSNSFKNNDKKTAATINTVKVTGVLRSDDIVENTVPPDLTIASILPPDTSITLKPASDDSVAFTPPPFYLYLPLSQPISNLGKPIIVTDYPKTSSTPSNQANSPLASANLPKSIMTSKTTVEGDHFALAMGYLPENIYNGTDNSVFYNVDLTASYSKEKIRFNTAVGMAYNEDEFEVKMNYDINTPVTAIGPTGFLDTVSYHTASLQSDYIGSEKHQYFTYNLGLGARLFGYKKFSTWINAGAGFGLMLNNPDLVSYTENSVKNQYNASITGVSTDKPVYNDVNVNFVTGIDFNYAVIKRLSISFTPTSRWYFKPVLSKNNQATDELTFGFKTGLKFIF
jgi:hypothetical protein